MDRWYTVNAKTADINLYQVNCVRIESMNACSKLLYYHCQWRFNISMGISIFGNDPVLSKTVIQNAQWPFDSLRQVQWVWRFHASAKTSVQIWTLSHVTVQYETHKPNPWTVAVYTTLLLGFSRSMWWTI